MIKPILKFFEINSMYCVLNLLIKHRSLLRSMHILSVKSRNSSSDSDSYRRGDALKLN